MTLHSSMARYPTHPPRLPWHRSSDLAGPARTIPIILLAQAQDEADELFPARPGADEVLAANSTLEDLTGAIRRHVWFNRPINPEPDSSAAQVEETEEGIPILSAERIMELRANLPRDELLEMVEECIADLFHRLPALRRSLATGASGAITAQTHAMVGMAGGYGMAVLEARLRAILTAVRTQRLDTIDGAAAMIESDLTSRGSAARVARCGCRTRHEFRDQGCNAPLVHWIWPGCKPGHATGPCKPRR